MTSMSMSGKAGRSGRKGNSADKQLLRDLGRAKANEPPKKFVDAGKRTVRGALRRRGK